MNRFSLAALAAAAIVAVGVLAYNFRPTTNSAAPTTIATPSASPVLSPSPLASLAARIQNGSVTPGTYSVASDSNTVFTVDVAAGWSYDGGALSKGDPWFGNGVSFAPWIVTHVYGDSCHWQGTLQEAGTRDELVGLLRAIKPFRNLDAPDTIVGRAPYGFLTAAVTYSLEPEADLADCDESFVRLWPDTGGAEDGGIPLHPGMTINAYVVETDGKSTVFVAIQNADSDPEAIAELHELVGSIQQPR